MDQAGRRLAGIACLCAGVAVFSLQDILVKKLSGGYPIHQIIVIRSLVALPLLLIFVHYEAGIPALRTRRPGMLALRGAILLACYTTFYLSVAALPLATAVALSFSSPLFIAALAWPMLGERVGIGRLLAIVVGFAGVLVVARPSDGAFEPAAGLAVLSAAFYAVGQVLSRRLGVAAPSSVMALYQNCVFIAGGATMAAVVGSGLLGTSDHPSAAFLLRSWVVPPLTDGLLLLGGGIVAGTGAWLLTRAYAMTEVNTVAPFEYTALAWGTLWGYVLWNEIPDVWVFAGIALVLGSSFYVLRVRAPGP